MELQNHAENRLLVEIEALRAQYADTQDLYREVCVVLFFRHGITPTANKLYRRKQTSKGLGLIPPHTHRPGRAIPRP